MQLASDSQIGTLPAQPQIGIVKWFGLFGWIAVCFAAAATGAPYPPDEWYAELNRPAFAPPNSVFGPVWSILYLSMAVAAWIVWKRDKLSNTWLPLTMFLFQLSLNAAWTWLFFGLHRIDLALLDIVALLAAILATIVLFRRVSRVAGFLLIPYFAWVAFASALNFEFWRLNP